MLVQRRIAILTVLAATLFAPQSKANISKTIYLSGYVPVLCNVELFSSGGLAQTDGVVNLGTTEEFCNAPRGYRLILQHPANLSNAAVISDATRIPLSESGETIVADSDHPDLQVRHLALDLGADPAALNRLGLRMEVNY